MAYTINLTNGSIFATVPDGTFDTTSSLVLIGKNYNGYGEFIAENFMRLLENGASVTAPSNPVVGQMWFNSNLNLLQVYDGNAFKNLATAASTATQPAFPVAGDLWFDTATAQLKMYNGTAYDLVGPLYSTATGKTGPIVDTIEDIGSTQHVVEYTYIAGEIVAIASKDAEFTPIAPGITGFTTIKPGIQLSSTLGVQFTGTATNSLALGGVVAANYLRSDTADTTTGTLGILNDGGLTVGADSDLKLSVIGTATYITSNTYPGTTFIQARAGDGIKDVITLATTATTARARVSAPLAGLDIVNKDYADTKLNRDGSNDITGVINPATDGIIDLGESGKKFNTIYATTFNGSATLLDGLTQTSAATASTIAARDASGGITAAYINTSNLGYVGIGDDITIRDVSVANTAGIIGQQNPVAGYLKFGNTGPTVGNNGDGVVRIGATTVVSGDVWATNFHGSGAGLTGLTQPLGVGQAWYDMTGSRTSGVTYTNTTGRSIFVALNRNGSGGCTLTVNGIVVGLGNNTSTLYAVVPNGNTYLPVGFNTFMELR